MVNWRIADRKNFAAFFLNLSRTGGEVVHFNLSGRRAFLVNRPQYAEHVLCLNESNYENPYHPYKELSEHYQTPGKLVLKLKRGSAHESVRQIANEFTRAAQNTAADLQQACGKRSIRLAEPLRKWICIAVARLLFDVNLEHLSEAFVKASLFAEICWTNGLFSVPSSRPGRAERQYLSAIEVQQRTVAWIAHEARIVEEGQPVSEIIRAAILRTLLNGYNALAVAACWTIYLVLKHDDVRAKLDHEVKEMKSQPALGAEPRYLKMVIKEALRLYPPAWILGRKARAGDRLGETFIPAGAQLFISPYTMQRDASLWESPNDFVPNRFGPRAAGNLVDCNS